jgi:spore coat polysaccharide biosynthesis protein SpsF
MSVAAIIQARMGSTRLPGKALCELAGEPMLAHVVRRAMTINHVDRVLVATTTAPVDDPIEVLCRSRGWFCFRGSEDDVLDRYYQAARSVDAAHVVRITSDCPLVCVDETGRLIAHHLASGADYTHNVTVWGSGMPLGTGSEVFTFESLAASWREGTAPHHREHVDEYVYEHPERFHIRMVTAPVRKRRPELRLTVDTPEDLELMRAIYGQLHRPQAITELQEVIWLLDRQPDLDEVNRHVVQKRY